MKTRFDIGELVKIEDEDDICMIDTIEVRYIVYNTKTEQRENPVSGEEIYKVDKEGNRI